MDGNGRWATKKGLPRSYGHNKGVSVLKEIIKISKKISCKVFNDHLTIFSLTFPAKSSTLLYPVSLLIGC